MRSESWSRPLRSVGGPKAGHGACTWRSGCPSKLGSNAADNWVRTGWPVTCVTLALSSSWPIAAPRAGCAPISPHNSRPFTRPHPIASCVLTSLDLYEPSSAVFSQTETQTTAHPRCFPAFPLFRSSLPNVFLSLAITSPNETTLLTNCHAATSVSRANNLLTLSLLLVRTNSPRVSAGGPAQNLPRLLATGSSILRLV